MELCWLCFSNITSVRMRDAWTTLAKRCEDFNISDVTEK